MKTVRRVPYRVWWAVAVPFLLLAIGTLGFKSFGEPGVWTWFDALYMSAITLTTLGYGETHPLTTGGRWFTIVYAFGGIFLLFFSATEMIRAIVSGQFRETLGREGVKKALSEIRDHVIVCGFGRMGRLVCQEFEKHEIAYVVVDREEGLLNETEFAHGLPVHGDATEDEILKRAGVERAKTLLIVLPSDAANLYITLSARVLNANLLIVARAEHESSEQKLRRVGANQVVSPYVIGGHRAAQAVLRPTVGHFLDQAFKTGPESFHIEEVTVSPDSRLCGKTIRETGIGRQLSVVVISIRRPSGELVFNPRGNAVIEAGGLMIVVGRREELDELERQAAGERA